MAAMIDGGRNDPPQRSSRSSIEIAAKILGDRRDEDRGACARSSFVCATRHPDHHDPLGSLRESRLASCACSTSSEHAK
jgi:hypothetical protein